MSNGYKKKSISWYALWKRIGKQPMYKTQNTKVHVLIDGELKECALVFTNNDKVEKLNKAEFTEYLDNYWK